MNGWSLDQGTVAAVALGFAMMVQLGVAIWWASGISQQVKTLKEDAKASSAMRELVIELRTEMRGFRETIKDLAEGLRGRQRQRIPAHDDTCNT
jgi:hypothetical protein